MQDDSQNQVPGVTPVPPQPPVTQNPFPQQPQAPVSPAFGTAPQPFEQPQPVYAQPPVSYQEPLAYPAEKKSKKPLFIVLAIVLVLLIAAALAYVFLMPKDGSNGASATQTNSEQSDADETADTVPAGEKPSVTASTYMDFSAVCEGKKVSNAADASPASKLLALGETDDKWSPYLFVNDDRFSSDVSQIGGVVCVVLDESSKTGPNKCTSPNPTTKANQNVDFVGATYDVTLYAAKTGEKIGDTKELVATNGTCPAYAFKDGVQYAIPLDSDFNPIFNSYFVAS